MELPTDAIQVLREHACWDLVRQASIGRLAVALEGQPEIFPVNHVVDRGTVLFRTAIGTKLNAADGQRVAFEVDGVDEKTGEAWSVVLKGRAESVSSLDEVIDSYGVPVFAWQRGPKPVFIRVDVDAVSGRRFHANRHHADSDEERRQSVE